MSDQPRDLTLERIYRLSQAVADLMESNSSSSRMVLRALEMQGKQLDRIEAQIAVLTAEVRVVAIEQTLLGNRVEEAFTRALRTNIRLDEMEDAKR